MPLSCSDFAFVGVASKLEKPYVDAMISCAREFMKRRQTPQTFHKTMWLWWCVNFYFPRKMESVFIRRSATIHGGQTSLREQLQGINVYAPSRLCRIMTRHGSDKGEGWHNYTTLYSSLFAGLEGQPLCIFELGLGTHNPEFAYSMGADGRPGASLRGWREIFPKAEVFGADIDRSILFREPGIQTFFCDQTDPASIRDLWAQPALAAPIDILIEDALHEFSANLCFLEASLQKLKVGGTYVTEDIKTRDLPQWLEHLPTLDRDHPGYEFALVELPNEFNDSDNNLLLVRRMS